MSTIENFSNVTYNNDSVLSARVRTVRNSPYNVTVKTTLTSAKVSWLPAHVEGARYHHLIWYNTRLSLSLWLPNAALAVAHGRL